MLVDSLIFFELVYNMYDYLLKIIFDKWVWNDMDSL